MQLRGWRMTDFLTGKGIIGKMFMPNAFSLRGGGMFSLYGGLPIGLSEGANIEFKYKTKEKDGKVYNNIVDGSIVMAPSQDKVLPPSSSSPDRDALRQTWIVRQNCKDSAIDVVKAFPLPETIDEAKKKILELAEEFEKWV